MKPLRVAALPVLLGLAAPLLTAQQRTPSRIDAAANALAFPASVPQGSLVLGRIPAGASGTFEGRTLQPTSDGTVVFGVGRDVRDAVSVSLRFANGETRALRIAVTPRDWPIQRVNGVPANTVNPPPAIAARIARENGRIAAARRADSANTDFAQAFIWPVRGRVSGRFGNQRIFNGTPKSPHAGMDIAASSGTPVKAPAGGRVTLAERDFFLTGGTVMIDHGHGVSSNFLHLSRIDVKVGDVLAQGDVLGAVGATGRATGPHLHWGMTWFDTKIDPLLVLERAR